MKLVVVGAGGHGKVVLSTALEAGYEVLAALDDDPGKWGTDLLGVPIWGPISSFRRFIEEGARYVLAIGDNKLRKDLANRMSGVSWAILVHPRAYVHATASLGEGTVVFAGAVVQPMVRVGRHVILNTSSVVEHDCQIGDWVHLASGARLAGSAKLGEGASWGLERWLYLEGVWVDGVLWELVRS